MFVNIKLNYYLYQLMCSTTVENALKKAKCGTAPGPGNAPVELLKAGGPKMLQTLTEIVNMVLRGGGELPEDLKTEYLSPIYKKGDRRVCKNYWGICIQSTVSRLIGRILTSSLEQQFVSPPEQCGVTTEVRAWIISLY